MNPEVLNMVERRKIHYIKYNGYEKIFGEHIHAKIDFRVNVSTVYDNTCGSCCKINIEIDGSSF